uniref:Uncharacterized protein n=1 Tax=Syphacia muris TaxID=451379 RepID=A0A0N5ARW5_9BILA
MEINYSDMFQRISVRSQSMGELMLIPSESNEAHDEQPSESGSGTGDPGWLIKIRTNRYLESVNETENKHGMRRARSVDYLRNESNKPPLLPVGSNSKNVSPQIRNVPITRITNETIGFLATDVLRTDEHQKNYKRGDGWRRRRGGRQTRKRQFRRRRRRRRRRYLKIFFVLQSESCYQQGRETDGQRKQLKKNEFGQSHYKFYKAVRADAPTPAPAPTTVATAAAAAAAAVLS